MKSLLKKWFGSEPKNTENQENTNENRRLVKNPSTGKYEWTIGESPLPTTVEELTYDNKQTIEVTDVKVIPEIPEFLFSNRFLVEAPGFDSKLIKSFFYHGPLSVSKSRSSVSKTKKYDASCMEIYVSKENYAKILKLKKGDSLGDIKISVLDRHEKTIFSALLKSAKVESIHLPIHLDYRNDNIIIAYIDIKHDAIKYSI